MSDSSRVQLYGLEETVYGTTDASPLEEVRFTGESLGLDITTTDSEEIRSDRTITDVITVGQEVAGDINFELSFGSLDAFFPGALYSPIFGAVLSITALTIDASNVDNSFNDSGLGFPAVVPGQWIKVTGFTGAGIPNNTFHQVVSRTTAKIVVSAASVLVTTAAGDSVTLEGNMIRSGVTKKGYTFEKGFLDITQFQSFTGCLINTMQLEVTSNSILTGSFGVIGLNGGLTQATVGTGPPVVANTNPVMNASSNVGTIREGEAALAAGIFIRSVQVNLNNQLRPQDAIGSLAHVDIGAGTLEVTGSLVAYFTNNALMDKYLAGTLTSLSFHAQDSLGNAYIFTVPNMKFTDGKVLSSGRNQDVVVDLQYTGIRHATQGHMFQLDRFSAV